MAFLKSSFKSVLLLGAVIALAGVPAAAQQNSANHETVTVTAPHVVRQQAKPATGKQASVMLLSVSRNVSYSDLDLSKKSDADIFTTRIHDAAAEGCKQLSKEYPANVYVPEPANQDCVGTATNSAMFVAKLIMEAYAR